MTILLLVLAISGGLIGLMYLGRSIEDLKVARAVAKVNNMSPAEIRVACEKAERDVRDAELGA